MEKVYKPRRDSEYGYLFDTCSKKGHIINKLWEPVLSIEWEIGRRINSLLFIQEKADKWRRIEKSNSSCHITANYLSWRQNDIWGIFNWVNYMSWVLDEGSVKNCKKIPLEQAIEDYWFPLLLRMWKEGAIKKKRFEHSLVILWCSKEWELIIIDQNGYWKNWRFQNYNFFKGYLKNQNITELYFWPVENNV